MGINVTRTERLTVGEVPLLIVGYGFGASFVALFMQLGASNSLQIAIGLCATFSFLGCCSIWS